MNVVTGQRMPVYGLTIGYETRGELLRLNYSSCTPELIVGTSLLYTQERKNMCTIANFFKLTLKGYFGTSMLDIRRNCISRWRDIFSPRSLAPP